jgi:geranylgeranyl diphosphate synthase type I
LNPGEDIKRELAENAARVDAFMMGELRGGSPAALHEASRHLIEAGGKRLRPYLTVKACEAVGGDPAGAVPYAAALEILHNFTLVHDDIMDNDDLRRGHPTVHKTFGVPMAILAGDLLFAKVYDIMARHAPTGVDAADVVRCIDCTTQATLTLCRGQALDMGFPDAKEVSEDDYVSMVGAKTSALFRACAQVGAILGGGSDEQVEALGGFAWDAGIAFQIVDDVLGLTSDEETLGKPVGSDIREGKKTLMVIHALKRASKRQREALMRALGVEEASEEATAAAVEALHASGSIAYAREKAAGYAEAACAKLDVLPDSGAKRDLRALVDYFVSRDH